MTIFIILIKYYFKKHFHHVWRIWNCSGKDGDLPEMDIEPLDMYDMKLDSINLWIAEMTLATSFPSPIQRFLLLSRMSLVLMWMDSSLKVRIFPANEDGDLAIELSVSSISSSSSTPSYQISVRLLR